MSHRSSTSFSSAKGVGLLSALLISTGGCVHYVPKPIAPELTAAALEARSLDAPGLRTFIAETRKTGPVDAWDFEALTLVAIYYNPTLAVARSQARSANAARLTAVARPNPTVSLSDGYNQDAAAGVTPWIPGINFDLPLETAGKRKARVDRADASIASARQTLLDTAWSVRRAVRSAWLDVIAAEARARLIEEQASVQSHVAELLEQRLAAGMISLPEVTSARLARQRSGYDAGEARRVAAAARAHLSEAMGVPLSALRSIKLAPLPVAPTPLPWTVAEARAFALRGRPDVVAALYEYQTAEADLQLQIAKQYPDIHFGPGLQWDQGERKWSLGATFEIPLFHRNQGPIAEAEAHREELAARVLAVQAKVMAELDVAFENRAQIEVQVERARGVYQAAEDQRRALESSRASGDADALQSESAKLESLSADLIRLDTLIAWHGAFGQIEDAVRQPLPYFSRLETSPRADAPTP